jgi:hypothetical protein
MDGKVEVRMSEQAEKAERGAAGEEAAVVCWLPATLDGPAACPLCARVGALVLVGEVLFCAACGYASDGVRGCT